MKQILYVEDLNYTGEVLNEYNSRFSHWVVVIVLILAALAAVWMNFGKKETVVRASGLIRPIENISFVKTVSGGKIKAKYFKHGDRVEKGEKLLTLDDTSLLKEKQNLLNRMELLDSKINDNKLCLESLVSNINLLPLSENIAYKKMQNYFEIKKNLTKIYDLSLKELRDIKSLPEFTTSEEKIKMLKLGVERNKSELDKFLNSFSQNLFTEKENLELQKEELDNALFRLNTALDKLIVYAPISGEVQELKSLNCGDNIFAGEDLLKLIPKASKNKQSLQAVVRIPTDKSGLICEDMKVKIKLPAFPHYEFGSIEGRIKTILPDSYLSEGNRNDYLAIVALENTSLKDKNGKVHDLKIGLGVNAFIVTETESIISYVLKKMEVK